MPKPKFMPKAMGPKTSFNWEIGDVIIERLAQGESLRAITKDPAMPSLATVLKWVANDVEGFAKPVVSARATQQNRTVNPGSLSFKTLFRLEFKGQAASEIPLSVH
jgi:hypothetical protein